MISASDAPSAKIGARCTKLWFEYASESCKDAGNDWLYRAG